MDEEATSTVDQIFRNRDFLFGAVEKSISNLDSVKSTTCLDTLKLASRCEVSIYDARSFVEQLVGNLYISIALCYFNLWYRFRTGRSWTMIMY